MAIIGALALVLGPVITGIVTYNLTKDDSALSSREPPRMSNLSVQWLGTEGQMDGRYVLTGDLENLGLGQMIWSYYHPLEEIDWNGDGIGDSGENVYPEYGPCTVDDDQFKCDLGQAGRTEEEAGKSFTIWAAVVTDEDAHAAALRKSGFDDRRSFPDADSVPHVDGDDTLVSIEVTRPPRG